MYGLYTCVMCTFTCALGVAGGRDGASPSIAPDDLFGCLESFGVVLPAQDEDIVADALREGPGRYWLVPSFVSVCTSLLLLPCSLSLPLSACSTREDMTRAYSHVPPPLCLHLSHIRPLDVTALSPTPPPTPDQFVRYVVVFRINLTRFLDLVDADDSGPSPAVVAPLRLTDGRAGDR